MQKKTTILLAAAASVTFAMPASAHRAWLLPSITVLSDANQGVTVDAGTSTDPFSPDHFPMNTDGIQVWAPDGTMGKIENPARGRYRSTFDVTINKPGTWRIGSASDNVSGTFKVNGELWSVGRSRRGGGGFGGPGRAPGAVAPAGTSADSGNRDRGPAGAGSPAGGGRPPMGGDGDGSGEGNPQRQAIDPSHVVASVNDIPAAATDFELTETQNRNEFFVTAGAPTNSVFRPAGKGLEMFPITHPTDLVANEPGKFRFLLDGKPAAALKVTVVPGGQRYRDAEHAQELTTDTDGVVTVSWPVPGFYWLNASLSDTKPSASKATKRRMGYTVTLEVVAP